jgi:hypothetical protein
MNTMKNIFNLKNTVLLAMLASAMVIASCKKDTDGSADTKPGNPVFSAVTPAEAAGGTVIAVTGSGLGGMRTIVFDKNNVPATFQPNLNTNDAILFRVPDTAFGGPQNIILTNADGKTLSVPFKVIALPTVSEIFPIEFEAGTVVTLTGNNLGDVTKVVIEGTANEATVVSKDRKKLVITMPATTVNRAKLRITNSSGERLIEQELTYIPNSFAIFVEGFMNGIQDWSWAGTHDVATGTSYHGTKSFRVIYSAGGWQGASLHKDDPKVPMSNYTYLTFWAKGGTADMNLQVWSENGGSQKTVTLPANKWSYFKMPIQGHMDGVMLERLNLQAVGPNGANQTIYFDNILLVK